VLGDAERLVVGDSFGLVDGILLVLELGDPLGDSERLMLGVAEGLPIGDLPGLRDGLLLVVELGDPLGGVEELVLVTEGLSLGTSFGNVGMHALGMEVGETLGLALDGSLGDPLEVLEEVSRLGAALG